MQKGIVFDLKEFAVHDGPGIRTTVFLKGCPLSCMWCHNPEGQACEPQEMGSPSGRRIAGVEYTSTQLAALLNRQAPIFQKNEGGVTFSGGEPLLQAEFIAEVIDQLDRVHILLDTSGFGTEDDLRLLIPRLNMVYYDIKLVNSQAHLTYTGVDNQPILQNLQILNESELPIVIRVPLVPGVTDTDENFQQIAQLVKNMPALLGVDLLPYNRQAGAKYPAVGMQFQPTYDENQVVHTNMAIFQDAGIKVTIR
jgi:pyruvate formate lyase activating enzyme